MYWWSLFLVLNIHPFPAKLSLWGTFWLIVGFKTFFLVLLQLLCILFSMLQLRKQWILVIIMYICSTLKSHSVLWDKKYIAKRYQEMTSLSWKLIKTYLSIQRSFIFAIVIRCSRLQLSEGYFIYFKLTLVLFNAFSLIQLNKQMDWEIK